MKKIIDMTDEELRFDLHRRTALYEKTFVTEKRPDFNVTLSFANEVRPPEETDEEIIDRLTAHLSSVPDGNYPVVIENNPLMIEAAKRAGILDRVTVQETATREQIAMVARHLKQRFKKRWWFK